MLYSSREVRWPRQYSYNGVSDYGFVDYFFCPRFVYGAVSAFINNYAGFRFERVLIESDNLHAYEFKCGEQRIVAFFAVKSPLEIRLASDADKAMLIDPMGNKQQLQNPRLITIKTSDYPQTILLDNTASIDFAAQETENE